MEKLELEKRIEAALNEQKRWEHFDPVLAALHEGRASAFTQVLADLVEASKVATVEFKRLGIAIAGLDLDDWPCQDLYGGKGAAIYNSINGKCKHPECHPANDDRGVD